MSCRERIRVLETETDFEFLVADIGLRIQVGMLLSSEILLAVLRKRTRKTLKLLSL